MVEHTRSLGFRVAFALGLGTMIAAGIFSLSGTAVAAIGSSAVIAFIIAAVIAGITAASYSEFASIYSQNGGGYLFSSRTFGNEYLLYGVGVSLFMGYCATTAFYLATMDEWFQQFIIPHGIHVPHGSVAVLTTLLLGYLNARGTEESGTFQVIVTGAKVAVLLAFIGGALAYKPPAATVTTFTSRFSADIVGILQISAVAFITFFGFSAIAASAGEIIKPRETVPKAIAASMLTVTVLYVFVIVAMINSPTPAEVIARQGETAMGKVAADFLGSIGRSLIVAGAVFSMVSASNASILAATGIGNLMGRQGQAPRRFSRLHPEHGTPTWSVGTVTATIAGLIVAFIVLLPADASLGTLDLGFLTLELALGLDALTGFANVNLLAPLAVVNVALIYSRRRFPGIERGFRVPAVPWLPILGIVANLALIYNLPTRGVIVAVLAETALVGAYLVWGGRPEIEELMERTVPATTPTGEPAEAEAAEGRYRVLVPINRPNRAVSYVRLAGALAAAEDRDPLVQVVNVTELPEQTPSEWMADVAQGRADRFSDELAEADLDVDYTVEGHLCRDVGFDIVQTARSDDADLIVMGYPKHHREVAEKVEYDSPCDVVYASDIPSAVDLSVVNIGAGGGPHHGATVTLANRLGNRGSTVHVINVTPAGAGGTAESVADTLDELVDAPDVEVHEVDADNVADGLVDTAAENGGVLVIGASRTRLLKRWVLGSTPDRVIQRAAAADVPVMVIASSTGIPGRIEDFVFPIYRYYRGLVGSDRSAHTEST